EFVYLAVILDGYSRRVIGWALERTLASRLAVAALEQAILQRQPPPGLVHHSDRGVQLRFKRSSQHYFRIRHRYSSRASAGVFQPRVLRGRLLRAAATASRSWRECLERSVPFGK